MLLVALGLVYFSATMGAGLRFLRRSRTAARSPERLGESDVVYFLIPCLNEAAVIRETVSRLLTDDRVHVVVIDDASDDDTGPLAEQAAHGMGRVGELYVVRRELPAARQGKGPALNAGFALIASEISSRDLDASRVVVCVMDADGRLSDGAIDEVLPLFNDPAVGGVQLAVRIRNRTSWLTSIQDMEFWALSAISQFGRAGTGTVSLGGNGQFTRLSALLAMDGGPWAQALTEDLELALDLAAEGWVLTTTTTAHVDQQGLLSLSRLINQRTRWFQGHMTAIRHVPRIWGSPHIPHLASLEMILYLLVPWTLVLPWSIVFHASLFVMLDGMTTHGYALLFGPDSTPGAESIALWYGLSFAPNLVAAYFYRLRAPEVSWLRALVLGHLLVPANYIAYVACWRALRRLCQGKTGWVKTARVKETPAEPAATRTGPAGAGPVGLGTSSDGGET
ncbi:glycosyltransferase family 2 protein [Kitasatospora kifunensis]|uniref:Cellulose synthase/poly-beta-1,6-N-acetylglucosamine synthase-like glycosyltransferase n=1 Tax=Kitasatospora kifunensis TaxID=58351 RepID=A0A7W7R9Y9_KITKI|nr:glycosyltransferase family 2 protein [Kitasatospora kifunensis]MBB4928162.1 cellulose synthase/poly-beta-1,6-N-acetylglucosamine synthase-like glycosyltransferase [Kitasatospora kifunensis]